MKIGIGLPIREAHIDGDFIKEWSRQADQAGFSSLAVTYRVVFSAKEPLIALGVAAAVTQRIRLMTTVIVVPTRSMPEALAALVVYDPEADVSSNAAEMSDAAEAVTTGEVTQAVRATNSDAGPINEGDWIVFRPIDGWSITVNNVLCRMIDDMNIKGRVDHPDRVW